MRRLRIARSDRHATHDPDTDCGKSRRIITRTVVLTGVAALAVGALSQVRPSRAHADPSANDWLRLRMCESGNNYRINTGNNHYGAYQFDLPTWRSVGGTGYPNQASPAEQDARALMLYRMRGWQPWQCAGIVGLTDDADARSGRISDIHIGGSHAAAPSPPPGSHGWPGVYYGYGDHSAGIRTWQLRMKARGAPLTGTGQFGPVTLSVVKALQQQNGLPPTGILGPNTWALAWTGKYRPPARIAPTPRSHPAAPQQRSNPPAPARGGGSPHGTSAPRWPGPQYFSVGDNSATIKAWQRQMKTRGAPIQVTGQFGLTTLAVVRSLQQQNARPVTGILGPNTWQLAWTGTYRKQAAAPPWPGPQYYSLGDHSATIKAWQLQMKSRGAPLTGTGQFGSTTLAVVKRLQRENGRPVTGILGPNTWMLAWMGTY